MLIGTLLTVALLAICTTGCSWLQTAPPTKVESALFDSITNTTSVTNLMSVTNMTQVTNMMPSVVTVTSNGVASSITNLVPQVVTQPVITLQPVVQPVVSVSLVPKATTTAGIQTAGAIGNVIMPGAGMLITGLLGGLFTMWGKLRSTTTTANAATAKAAVLTKLAGVSQAAVATAQAVIAKTNPSASTAFNTWLAAHQSDVDIAEELATAVDGFVDPTHTSTIAEGIIAQAAAPLPVAKAA